MGIAQLCVLGTLLIVFPFASMAASGGSPPETDSDASAGSTKTYMKYTPFEGLTKIELPGLPLPRLGDSGLEGKQFVVSKLLPVMQMVHFKDHPREVLRASLVEIPFGEVLRFEDLYTEPDESVPADENPFERAEVFHEPFFSLFYGVIALYHPESEMEESDRSKRATVVAARLKVLDSPFFCLNQWDTWRDSDRPSDEQPYQTQWFGLPMVTTFERKETANSHLWRILDVPLAMGFLYDKEGSQKKVRLLDLTVASLYRQDECDEGGKSAVLETPAIMSDWSTAALWRKERMEDETVCQQFVRLPLLGPVWSVWNEPQDDGRRMAFLPRLLFWKYPAFAR